MRGEDQRGHLPQTERVGVVEAIRVRECVCVYRDVRSQTTDGVGDVRRKNYHSVAGGCSTGDSAGVVYVLAAYYVGDYGYVTFGGRDCGTTGD